MFENSCCVNNVDLAGKERWFMTLWRGMDGWMLLHGMSVPLFAFCAWSTSAMGFHRATQWKTWQTRDHGQPQDFGKELQLSIKHISSNLKLSFYSNTWLSTAFINNFQKGQSLCLPSCCIAGSNTIPWCFTKYLRLQSFSDNWNCFCQYSSHKTHLAFFGGENGTDILISVGTTPCLFKN